ncbi:unnamed protein product [Rhodiola kirilowii]
MAGNEKNSKEKSQPAAIMSAASTRLLLFMAPLILGFLLIAFLGPKSFDWEFKFQSPWVARSSFYSDTNDGGSGGVSTTPSPSPSPAESVRAVGQESLGSDSKVGDGKDKVLTNDSTLAPSPNISPYLTEPQDNVSFVNEPAAIVRRDVTRLDRLEAGLQIARAAIRDAGWVNVNQTPFKDQDYIPNGPMYWNSKAFQRSYLEMEKQLKIYVYGEGEPPLFHNGPCKSIYSTEGNFIHGLEADRHFRTKDPEKAHLFFLPFSVTNLVRFVYDSDSHDFGPIKHTVADYVKVITEKYPYWNRSLGADHFMLACHDWGPEVSRAVPNLYKYSIRVLCNANTSEGFVPSKDVSFPEINLVTGHAEGFIGGPSPSKRTILAFFAGGLHGPIRPILVQHWENKDPDMQVHRYLPKGVSYYDMMKKSKFCLCPSGYEVASPRIVEALYAGCVPVLLSSGYVAPFSDVLNWKAFSVVVPVEDIPNLKQILSRISSKSYIRMQRRGVQVRRHFVVNSPPKRFDVYHMILHSIWLRRLNIRIHEGGQAQ